MSYLIVFFFVAFFILMIYILISTDFLKKQTIYSGNRFYKRKNVRIENEIDPLFQSLKKEVIYNQHFFRHKKVVITGELRYFKTRNELAKLLWENGAIIQTAFNSSVDILIVGKSTIDSSKLKNAYFLNKKVITEEELLHYLPNFINSHLKHNTKVLQN